MVSSDSGSIREAVSGMCGDVENQKKMESGLFQATSVVAGDGADTDEPEPDSHHHLHRGLKARHVAMIAIGGSIGTGLIIGT